MTASEIYQNCYDYLQYLATEMAPLIALGYTDESSRSTVSTSLLERFLRAKMTKELYPFYSAPLSVLANNLAILAQTPPERSVEIRSTQLYPAPKSKEPLIINQSTKVESIEAFFAEVNFDQFEFLVDTWPATIQADRRLVLHLETLELVPELINLLLRMMGNWGKEASQAENPFRIQKFKTLLNTSPIHRYLSDHKVEIHYQKGVVELDSPYFDTNGRRILESLTPLALSQSDLHQDRIFFPFLLPVGEDNFAAWGGLPASGEHATATHIQAIADLLFAWGELPEDPIEFMQGLKYFFARRGIDPAAPHLFRHRLG